MKETNSIRGYEQAERNILRLCKTRMKCGITKKRLSQLSGVNEHTLNDTESGRYLPTIKTYNKLAQVFGWKNIDNTSVKKSSLIKTLSIDDLLDPPEPVKLLKPVIFTFTISSIYRIYAYEADRDNEYVFCYEGKQGIHHMFREIRGGWSRTFTDAQLIGKKIVEVNKDEKD